MPPKKKIPPKFRVWIEARQRHKLSHLQIQMARELGMNPKNFGKLDNHDQEPWKLSLGQFIENCYLDRFRNLPENVLSIEQRIKLENQKKAARREAKVTRLAREKAALAHDAAVPNLVRPSLQE